MAEFDAPIKTPTSGVTFDSVIDQDKSDVFGAQQTQTNQQIAQSDYDSSATGFLKNFGSALGGEVSDIGKSIWNTWKATPGQFAQDFKNAQDANAQYQANDSGNAGASLRDTGKMLFKSTVPMMSTAVNAIFAPFSAALGEAINKSGAGQLVDKTGTVIADKTGIKNWGAWQDFMKSHPNAGQYFNDSVNVALSMIGDSDPAAKAKINPADLTKSLEDGADNIVKQAVPVRSETPLPSSVKINTPNSLAGDYSKANGYEGYTPNDQLPEIQMGKGGSSSDLPTVQLDGTTRTPQQVPGDFTFEPVDQYAQAKSTQPTEPGIGEWSLENSDSSETRAESPRPQFEPERPIGADGTKITKSASDINTKLVQKGFGDMSKEDLATFTPLQIKDQVARVSSLMDSDMESAKAMALGQEDIPQGIHPKVLYNAIEKYADANDPQLSLDLAKSPLARQTSLAGQMLAVERFTGNNNESPTKILRDVMKTREAKLGKGTGDSSPIAKEARSIDESIQKSSPKKGDWKDFINSIACK